MPQPRRKKKDDETKERESRKAKKPEPTSEEQAELDESDSVLLLKTDNYLQAQFLVGALEEEEIPYYTKRLSSSDPVRGAITHVAYDAPGAAEIYVSADDYDRAKELLDALEGEGLSNFDEEDEEADEDEREDFYDEDEDER
ncbi:MAG: DUF2007 domain-containing protein [candidate division Zixibacteria bacterium]|nr:DUF2007 domain-containing protein [candidate division Zixibacteria bacterium]